MSHPMTQQKVKIDRKGHTYVKPVNTSKTRPMIGQYVRSVPSPFVRQGYCWNWNLSTCRAIASGIPGSYEGHSAWTGTCIQASTVCCPQKLSPSAGESPVVRDEHGRPLTSGYQMFALQAGCGERLSKQLPGFEPEMLWHRRAASVSIRC